MKKQILINETANNGLHEENKSLHNKLNNKQNVQFDEIYFFFFCDTESTKSLF